jgi:hypothetical protein
MVSTEEKRPEAHCLRAFFYEPDPTMKETDL